MNDTVKIKDGLFKPTNNDTMFEFFEADEVLSLLAFLEVKLKGEEAMPQEEGEFQGGI